MPGGLRVGVEHDGLLGSDECVRSQSCPGFRRM
jgi:hypothetical protein